jgi:hypothetical protein
MADARVGIHAPIAKAMHAPTVNLESIAAILLFRRIYV